MRAGRLGLAALAALLLALGGCGDDDSDDGGGGGSGADAASGSGSPSKAEFVEQGDQLCRDLRKRIAGLDDKAPATAAELAEVTGKTADASEETLSDFRELTPPEGDEDVIESYLSAIQDQITLLRKLEEAAGQGDLTQARAYSTDIVDLNERADEIAQGYGFKVCGAS